MMRLRAVSAVAAVGLAFACSSSEPPNRWSPDGIEAPGGSSVSPGDDEEVVSPSDGQPVSPTDEQPGVDGVAPATNPPPQSSTTPSTGVTPPTTGVDPNLTESNGYTPVLNGDGSIARPMWLAGAPADTRFARLTNEQWQRTVRDLLRLPELPTQESQF